MPRGKPSLRLILNRHEKSCGSDGGISCTLGLGTLYVYGSSLVYAGHCP